MFLIYFIILYCRILIIIDSLKYICHTQNRDNAYILACANLFINFKDLSSDLESLIIIISNMR